MKAQSWIFTSTSSISMSMRKNFFLFFVVSFLISCGNRNEANDVVISDTLKFSDLKKGNNIEKGKILSGIKCQSDSRFTYSLYLPFYYKEGSDLPVIIFFDPHAKADLPLQKYKKLSEKYGYILIASADSKNGIPTTIYPEIYNAIKKEIKSKYHTNGGRIYCAGFSGGARVAINIGLSDNEVSGVIANSAGFEPSRSRIKNDFVFAGVAGNEDFNLLEQRRTEASLDELQVKHLLIEFDGKHDWAPESSMEKIFVFLESANMLNHIQQPNDSLIKIFINSELEILNKQTNNLSRYQKLKEILPLIYNEKSYMDFNNQFDKLKSNPEVIRFIKESEENEAREAVLQREYYQKFFTESIDWWKAEVKIMDSHSLPNEKYLMNQRLKSYLSLAVYMTLISQEAKQDVLLLEKLIEIYSIVDPSNSEWAYQKALLRAKQGNLKESELLLLKCMKLGFSDKERFFSQQEFSTFYSNAGIIGYFK